MTEPLPTNMLVASLRLLAGSEPDALVRQELFDQANVLEQVLARTQFAHAPSRDQMQAALWGAQTGLNERLDVILTNSTDAITLARETQVNSSEALTIARETYQLAVIRGARLEKLELELAALGLRVEAIDLRVLPLTAAERKKLTKMCDENRTRIIALEKQLSLSDESKHG